MRKDEKEDKARVRVFFGEIEGNNETIRDGLRSIAAAVNKTFQLESTTVKVLTVGSDLDHKQIAAAVEESLEEIEASQGTPESESSEGYSPRSKHRRSRKAPSYSYVKDLDLRPTGQVSLRQFYTSKKPTDQQEKITVVLYYLYHILEIQDITANHIYTGLKDIDERVPRDIPQVLRSIASRKGWVDSSDSESFKTTVPGDNFVEHDLPAALKAEDHDRG